MQRRKKNKRKKKKKMKYFYIPEPVTLLDRVNNNLPYQKLCPDATQPTPAELKLGAKPVLTDEPPKTFWDWIKVYVIRDGQCNKGYETWSRVARITALLEHAEPGTLIVMDEDDWALLSGVINDPTTSVYPDALIAAQFFEFMRVVMEASGSPPAPKESE